MAVSTILIIDDEQGIRQSLQGILEDEGYAVTGAGSAEEGLAVLAKLQPDLIFLDIWLPGMDGLDALTEIKKIYDIPVIMISGHGTIETAVSALRKGAYDFIEKPLSLEKILLQVRHTLEMRSLRRENLALRTAVAEMGEDTLVGQSPPMQILLRDLARVAPTNASVLITGENGTGKELAARAVLRASKRADSPLVAVNCAAIPEELIESELFGYEKGAFTGAESAKIGKFEMAHQGTLFLDEIGDMSLKTQAKILRILEEQTFERVGGTRSIRVDVRIIAATNKNLEQAIKDGLFREDLYYRLRVFPLHMPSLRERASDIPLLTAALSARAAARITLPAPAFSPEAMAVMQAWTWPGNVRELAHLIERLTILFPDGAIYPKDLPEEMHGAAKDEPVADNTLWDRFLASDLDFKAAKALFEFCYLEAKLTQAGGNITKLSDMIGLERSYVHRKLKAGRCAAVKPDTSADGLNNVACNKMP